jgi:Tfp pilus assembly protein PilF
MLTDRYDLPLSTASAAARDAYVQGCAAKLTMYPGAIDAFDRALAADPGFALAHTAKAHALLERGDAAGAREAMAAAQSLATNLPAREASHLAYFALLVAGDSEAALTALRSHLDAWPRDALVLGTAAFTNGLIGSSGRAGQKRMLLALLEALAPAYGDDWWFTAHHGMALSENGDHVAAEAKIDRSLAQNPTNPWVAHARAHLSYEQGNPCTARAFLASWLETYPRHAPLFSHLNWHLALAELEAGDVAGSCARFQQTFAPSVHSGPPRGKLNDGVSFLWRLELAGQGRDAAAWRMMRALAAEAFPLASVSFADLHVGLIEAVAGDDAALAARTQGIAALVRDGRYPSEACVPAVVRGFAAFERGDDAGTIAALAPVLTALERISGSHAQLDLVRFTLVKAYLRAGQAEAAERVVRARRPIGAGVPVAGGMVAGVPAGGVPVAGVPVGRGMATR